MSRRLAACAALVFVALWAVPALAQRREQDEEIQLLVEEAKRALSKKDYARAGGLLDKVLVSATRRLDIYILRASIHGIVGHHDAAVALLHRARQLAPDNVSVLTSLGIELIYNGHPAEGVPMLARIVQRNPARYDAQVVLGHQYVKQGDWKQAAAAFDAYFAHRPKALAGEDSVHRLDQANAMLRSGDVANALAFYRKVLANNSKDEMARLGVAWSMAATSCRKAMPVLDELGDLERKYAEVSLVRGRCALKLGRIDEALARAERYRKAAPNSRMGWVLLGDVRAAQNSWKDAEAAYLHVAQKDATDAVIELKLARAERMLGKFEPAAKRLREAGPPKAYEDDWTIEYGESLLALRQATALRDLLTPWLATHQGHPTGELLLGSALVLLGEHADAVPHLELAAKKAEPRAGAMLVDALNTLAAAAVRKHDLAEARRRLDQAASAGGGPLTTRNLGAVLVAQGETDRAIAVLEKADAKDAAAQHLLARAYHGAKRWDDARAAYTRAVKAYGKDAHVVVVLRDLAQAELAAGRGEQALDALAQAIEAAPAAARKQLESARLDVARSAATDAMRSGHFSQAVRLLRSVEKSADGDDLVAVRCDLALAATGAMMRDQALDLLHRLERSKSKCPFVAPADDLGVPILIAWNEDARPSRARRALDKLEALRRRATGVAEPLFRQAGSDIALRAAANAYASGNLKLAARFLKIARGYDKRSPEITHNEAVLELASGSVDRAIAALDGVIGDVPEARINLGVAYEKKGEPLKALSAWRAAAAAGVRFGPLKDWIEAKERFWGTK